MPVRPKNTSYAVTIIVEHHGTEEEQNQDIEMVKEQLTVDIFEQVVETDRFLFTDMVSVVELGKARGDGTMSEDSLFA